MKKNQNKNIEALHQMMVQAGLDPATTTLHKLTTHFIKKRAVKWGRQGGKAGTGKSKARTPEQARAAAMVRWNKVKTKTTK